MNKRLAVVGLVLVMLCGCHPDESPPTISAEALSALRKSADQSLRGEAREHAAGAAVAHGTGAAAPAPRSSDRLIDYVAGAVVDSTWETAESAPEALARIGSASIIEPSELAFVEVVRMSKTKRHSGLRLTGFSVAAEEVGTILIRARFGASDSFGLLWGKRGRSAWPLEEAAPAGPDGWREIRIATAGLPEWSGRIDGLTVVAPGDPQALAIDEIAFLPPAALFQRPVTVHGVMLERELRQAICLRGGTRIDFASVRVGTGARLTMGLGVAAATGGSVRIFARAGSERALLFESAVAPTPHWTEADIALPADGRTTLDLSIESAPGAGIVCLGEPRIYTPEAKPRRFLVYLIDTLSAPHVGFYGYERETMPHLRRLATRGTWFANAFANASRTIESIPNLMLSLPTATHGVRHSFAKVDAAHALLAEDFRSAGYATGSFVTNVNAGPRQNLDRGFDSFFDHVTHYWSADNTRTVPIDSVLEWAERHRQRSFFLYVHTAEPHSPYLPPEEFRGHFGVTYDPKLLPSGAADRFKQRIQKGLRDQMVSLYDEEILYADAQLARLLERLEQAGLADDLVVVVTSDHGEEFGQHGKWRHGRNVYGETIRVPLVIAAPKGGIPAAGRVDAPVQLLDVRPTLLALAGLEPAGQVAGLSLTPLLRGEDPARFDERAILASTFEPKIPRHTLIRMPWKLVYEPHPHEVGSASAFELYDMRIDPREEHDVFADQPAVGADLIRALVGANEALEHRLPEAEVELDAEHVERLRALGYVDGD